MALSGSIDISFDRGEKALLLDRHDEVRARIKVLEEKGELTLARLLEAELGLRVEKIEDARKALFNLKSDDVYIEERILAARAALTIKDGDAEAAEEMLKDCSATSRAFYTRGSAAWERKDGAKAWDYLVKALEINPLNSAAISALVIVGLDNKRIPELIGHLENYLRQHPFDLNIRCCLASCLATAGANADATSELKKVLFLNPRHEEANRLAKELQKLQ